MATSGRGTGIVGHNVQTAVDTKNPLIVVHEVTNVGHDRSQLASRMKQAKAAMGASALNVVGDRGYYSGEEIRHCHEAGITAFVPSA
jgi:transposase